MLVFMHMLCLCRIIYSRTFFFFPLSDNADVKALECTHGKNQNDLRSINPVSRGHTITIISLSKQLQLIPFFISFQCLLTPANPSSKADECLPQLPQGQALISFYYKHLPFSQTPMERSCELCLLTDCWNTTKQN